MTTPAELIGTGKLWSSQSPDRSIGYPKPFPTGLAMGMHLSVERLIRIAEHRLLYFVDNLSRKWKRITAW